MLPFFQVGEEHTVSFTGVSVMGGGQNLLQPPCKSVPADSGSALGPDLNITEHEPKSDFCLRSAMKGIFKYNPSAAYDVCHSQLDRRTYLNAAPSCSVISVTLSFVLISRVTYPPPESCIVID